MHRECMPAQQNFVSAQFCKTVTLLVRCVLRNLLWIGSSHISNEKYPLILKTSKYDMHSRHFTVDTFLSIYNIPYQEWSMS